MTSKTPSTQTADFNFVAYDSRARFYHWLVVFLILIQFPLGFYMHYRAHDVAWVNADGEAKTGLFDATTRFLYDSHKLMGLILLALILARLYHRVTAGAPSPHSGLSPLLAALSKYSHALIYVALIAVPFLGYAGAAYFGATTLFGTIHVPSIVIEDKEFGHDVFGLHLWAAYFLLALIVIHIAAAVFHHMVRRDDVLARMLPGARRKSDLT